MAAPQAPAGPAVDHTGERNALLAGPPISGPRLLSLLIAELPVGQLRDGPFVWYATLSAVPSRGLRRGTVSPAGGAPELSSAAGTLLACSRRGRPSLCVER